VTSVRIRWGLWLIFLYYQDERWSMAATQRTDGGGEDRVTSLEDTDLTIEGLEKLAGSDLPIAPFAEQLRPHLVE